MNNVLLLSAGRRVELAQAFIKEVKMRNEKAKVFATDLQPDFSAACQIADDNFIAPRVTDPSYIDFLLSTALNHHVDLVIPTIDTELLLLAKHRDLFESEGVHLIISNDSLVEKCRDKRLTQNLFIDLGIDTPKIYTQNNIIFPCFAKPFDGSSSIGATKILSESDLTKAILADEKMMFMELIGSDFSEYTIDAYFDHEGELRCLVPRLRLEIRAGEVSKGVTRRDHVYDYLMPKLKLLRGARGCITIQIFAKKETGQFAAIEINPRFGGGFPLSYSAGANYPGWLLDEYLLGKEITFFDGWKADMLMLRYDAKVIINDFTT